MNAGLRPNLTIVLVYLLMVNVSAAAAQVAIPAMTRPDFNGDGKEDLAVGVPGENTLAGGVHIIYGSASGLTTAGNQLFTQNSPGIPGGEEDYDHCGASVTAGDFNGDGFADLAFGCPGEDAPSASSSGAVMVIYGSSAGLTSAGSQFWSQNSPGINGGSETLDRCGTSLATGDINRDGFADLVWGCPGEDVGTAEDAGAINVLFGSAAGLTATGNRFLSQDTAGIPDAAEGGDDCGTTVATGDFNADGRADIAWGCPNEDHGLLLDAGAVSVAYGAAGGISSTAGQFLHQNTGRSIDEGLEAFDKCGQGLATGDFNDDTFVDLAIGCPGEDIAFPILNDAGGVHILFGSGNTFQQGGLLRTFPGRGDQCGKAVTAGDINDDGFADFAIGCPEAESGAGRMKMWTGGSLFDAFGFVKSFGQDGNGGTSESGDNFGHAVAFADFNGDGRSDIAVGAPNEDLAGVNNAGAVNVLYAPLGFFETAFTQFFSQAVSGIVDASELNDGFGFSLAGSGSTPLPGLTGRWEDLAIFCRGAADDRCRLTATFTALNPSLGPTPRVALRFYLSADTTLDEADTLLAEMPVKPLDVGESQRRRLNVALPPNTDTTGHFVIAFVDADDIVEESNEANNVIVSAVLD